MGSVAPLAAWGLLTLGMLTGSTSVLFIKASTMSPTLLVTLRLLVSAAVLSPFYFRELRERRERGIEAVGHREVFRSALLPSIFLSIHFISWVIGARLTSAGNSTLIVNMSPVAMPFAAALLVGVRPTRRELVATGLSIGGVVLMGAADFSFSSDYFLGDLVCLGSMLLVTIYLALGRRANPGRRIFTYMVPLFTLSGLQCLVVVLATPGALAVGGLRELLLALGLALGPTVVGHSILNWSMTVLRPQTVSIANLFQFVAAVIFAYFLFGERPSPVFYATTVLIVAGAILALTDSLGGTRRPGK